MPLLRSGTASARQAGNGKPETPFSVASVISAAKRRSFRNPKSAVRNQLAVIVHAALPVFGGASSCVLASTMWYGVSKFSRSKSGP